MVKYYKMNMGEIIMKTCSRCGRASADTANTCPYCGLRFSYETMMNNYNAQKLNNNRKKLIILMCSLIGVVFILVAVLLVVLFMRKDTKSFDFDCKGYTSQMNSLLGDDKLDENKWVVFNDTGDYKYTEDSFEIELGTDTQSKKVNKICVGPSDSETGIKMAAASMMVADGKTEQSTAMDDIVALKKGTEKKVIHNNAVTEYNTDKKSFIIKPVNSEAEIITTKAAEATTAHVTAAETTEELTEEKTTEEQTTVEETTEEETTEEPTEAPTAEWKQAYIDFLNDSDETKYYDKYALVEVDDDGIPELYGAGNFHMAGSNFIYYDGSSVQSKKMMSGFAYSPKSGVLKTTDMYSGVSSSAFYSFSAGVLTQLDVANDSENSGQDIWYKWNNKMVSKEEYYDNLAKYDYLDTTPVTVSKQEIIAKIQAY